MSISIRFIGFRAGTAYLGSALTRFDSFNVPRRPIAGSSKGSTGGLLTKFLQTLAHWSGCASTKPNVWRTFVGEAFVAMGLQRLSMR
ncbi:hypothetical protein WT27_11105 [Burkholderia territorii]|uniref:Uncharacterized protein n=1 Tax=Burkholderia territorii TaxID=1503055 RepID=A0A105V713_9BURK|nr:hypothetical protein WT27_11105 [Burkholderia territorii]KVX41060.1 hypothetical protein WT31_30050 [Burkholderia territorii]